MLDDVSVRYLVLVLLVVLSFVSLSIFLRVVVDLYYTCKKNIHRVDTPTEKTCVNCNWRYHLIYLHDNLHDNEYTRNAFFCIWKRSAVYDIKACEHWHLGE